MIGNFKWNFYENALAEGLMNSGATLLNFHIKSESFFRKIIYYKKIKNINKSLINFIILNEPDVIFFYRSNEIFPSTLKIIKKHNSNIKLVFYHNDNPFYGLKNTLKYILFLRCLKHTDITYVYRPSNILSAKKYNAKNVKLLMPHYYSKIHLSAKINFQNKIHDIIFIGHYEKDRGYLVNKFIQSNINIKVFGGKEWNAVSMRYGWPKGVVNKPVYGKDYFNIISKSKIALCFLSKLNNDVYTRRIFEIPAIGTLVLSEYTEETNKLFASNKEIILYESTNDMISKAKYFLSNLSLLEEITQNAHKKVISSKHSEFDRAEQILKDLSEI